MDHEYESVYESGSNAFELSSLGDAVFMYAGPLFVMILISQKRANHLCFNFASQLMYLSNNTRGLCLDLAIISFTWFICNTLLCIYIVTLV